MTPVTCCSPILRVPLLTFLKDIQHALVDEEFWIRFAGSADCAVSFPVLVDLRDSNPILVKVFNCLAPGVADVSVSMATDMLSYNSRTKLAVSHSLVIPALVKHPTKFVFINVLGAHGNDDSS